MAKSAHIIREEIASGRSQMPVPEAKTPYPTIDSNFRYDNYQNPANDNRPPRTSNANVEYRDFSRPSHQPKRRRIYQSMASENLNQPANLTSRPRTNLINTSFDGAEDAVAEKSRRGSQNKLAGVATNVAFGLTHNIGALTFWLFWQVPFVILSVAFFVLVLWVDQLMNNPQTWWESVLKIAISASNFLASKLSKISEIIFGFSVPNIQEASIALFLIFYFMSIITSWVFLCYALFKAQFSPQNKPSMLGIFACFVVGAIFIVNIYPAFIHASKGKR